MHCHLFIPDYFAGIAPESHADDERHPAAEILVARGRRSRHAATNAQSWLFERFGVAHHDDGPVAPYALLAAGVAPGSDFCLCADPVHLSAGHDGMTLADAPLNVSRTEADAIVDALNRHFGASLQFVAPDPSRWYLRLSEALVMDTTPLSAARGHPIDDCVPRGRDAMRAHALMTEAQMLLHDHPVNLEREAQGRPALNSIWLWGGGAINAPGGVPQTVAVRPFDVVIADDLLARGLALSAGIPAYSLPRDAAALIENLPIQRSVLLLPEVSTGVNDHPDDGTSRYRERRRLLDRDWFAPLIDALKSGRIGMLTLQLCGADSLLEIEIVRQDLRYFWRRRKPLARYAGT